jgi:hypothetical protein
VEQAEEFFLDEFTVSEARLGARIEQVSRMEFLIVQHSKFREDRNVRTAKPN